MRNDSGDEHPWGGAEDMRSWAAEEQQAPGYAEYAEPVGRVSARRTGRRKGPWPLLLGTLALTAAAALFFSGWFAHALLQDDQSPSASPDKLTRALFPEDGVTLDVSWGDVPRRLVEEGVIDLEKFRVAAEGANSPLTADQLRVLAEGSDEPLTVDAANAYFVLDVLWALGLANDNAILTEGPMAQRGWDEAGNYASTGGWTIGVDPGPEYLATLDLITLTPEQQAVVNEVAYNAYRPCCGNMTAFPDCNHGMAALALTELMASQGATADQIFQALKEISPFWFPDQYYQLALYFKEQDQDWDEIDPRTVVSEEYASADGFRQVSAWLQEQGAIGSGQPGGGNASTCSP